MVMMYIIRLAVIIQRRWWQY